MAGLESLLTALQLACICAALVWAAIEGRVGPLILALIACRIFANLRPSKQDAESLLPAPASPELLAKARESQGAARKPRKARGSKA